MAGLIVILLTVGAGMVWVSFWLLIDTLFKKNVPLIPQSLPASPPVPPLPGLQYNTLAPVYEKWPLPPPQDAPWEQMSFPGEQPQIQYPEEM